MRTKITTVFLVAALVVSTLAGGTERKTVAKEGIHHSIPNIKTDDYGDPKTWIKSGIYSYEFLDKEKRYISIRHIDIEEGTTRLEIPSTIDGCKVLGIGVWGLSAILEEDAIYENTLGGMKRAYDGPWTGCIWNQDRGTIEELVLPEGIEFIGTAAFSRGLSLKSVNLPKSLAYIGSYAFYNKIQLKEISIPEGVYVDVEAFPVSGSKYVEYYSNCEIGKANFLSYYDEGKREKVVIRMHEEDEYTAYLFQYQDVQNMYLDRRLKEMDFEMDEEPYEDHHANLVVPYGRMGNLYVNGKKTKVRMGKRVSADFIYTVPDAKVIKLAKKQKTTYIVKETGRKQEVKGKKKAGQYKATWEKVKTVRKKTEYKKKKKKWKTKYKTVQTEYKVYGKKTKNGTYKLLKTTTKNSIKSEYKYIKAVPVKTWNRK